MTHASATDAADVPDPLGRVRIVLVRPSHPGNIGAAARAMLTMGLGRLTLVEPRRFPDPEAEARASGATAVLDDARVVATLDDALAGSVLTVGLSARPREFAGQVLPVRAAAERAIATAVHGDVALVFGTEMSGPTSCASPPGVARSGPRRASRRRRTTRSRGFTGTRPAPSQRCDSSIPRCPGA